MPRFVDVRLRVREEKVGSLAFDLPIYAQWVGMEALKPSGSTPLLPPPSADGGQRFIPKSIRGKRQEGLVPKALRGKLSPGQRYTLKAIASGTNTITGLQTLFKRDGSKTNRIINNLAKKNLVKRSHDPSGLIDTVELIQQPTA